MRLNHYLAKAGIGSRREAERLMAEGRVKVNGTVVPAGGVDVADTDKVTVDGRLVRPDSAPLPRIFLYHKPAGPLVTADDPQGRTTIWDLIYQGENKRTLPRLVSVGRLDAMSEGLLLLTTDGALAQTLMSPKTALEREYRVRVFGRLTDPQLAKVRDGMRVKGVMYRGADIREERDGDKGVKKRPREGSGDGKNTWYRMVLTEGKNREIRRIFDHFRCTVNRLIRVRYGIFMLRDLPSGSLVEAPDNIVKKFISELPKREA